MRAIAIQFDDVSKQYRLGEIGTGSLSRDLGRAWARWLGRPDPYTIVGDENNLDYAKDHVWAIRNLSFEVRQGEVFGVIGRNGAGKSTLLKLLSRITAPTSGVIHANGKIASLLEVGTGFHPELTGRENVFLNGAILGMQRSEVRQRFDEIVEFSGCANYIDTPVKRYSSGMIVRLGFSVAAHLDCETLIVDEVLAVGDIDFQQRCIAKMQNVASSGRTILLVSHNMTTMSRLCDRCAILEKGELVYIGDTDAAVERYLKQNAKLRADADLSQHQPRSGTGHARFERFWIENESGDSIEMFGSGDTVTFCFDVRCRHQPIENLDVQFSIHELNGDILTRLTSVAVGAEFTAASEFQTVRCRLERVPLPAGTYTIEVRLVAKAEELDWPRGAVASFEVGEGDFYRSGRSIPHENSKFLIAGTWSDGGRE